MSLFVLCFIPLLCSLVVVCVCLFFGAVLTPVRSQLQWDPPLEYQRRRIRNNNSLSDTTRQQTEADRATRVCGLVGAVCSGSAVNSPWSAAHLISSHRERTQQNTQVDSSDSRPAFIHPLSIPMSSEAAAASTGSTGAAAASTTSKSATISGSSVSVVVPLEDLAVVHPESLQTGKPVEWEKLEEGYCCVCEGEQKGEKQTPG